ncbi:crossover junction endodeoxyribonuclease RuvC [soil metagenome]
MMILGIDPGLQRTGFGVLEIQRGKLRYAASGVIRTDPKKSLAERVGTIARTIDELVRETAPDCAAVEIVFVNANPQSTLLLGQARGAALAALFNAGLAVHEYTALQVKKATVGTGRASKVQVQQMVIRLLGLDASPQADAADALACAIAHGHSSTALAALGVATAGTAAPRHAALAGLKLRRGRWVAA